MRTRRAVSVAIAIGVLATGPACAKKNEDKLNLQRVLERSSHSSGVFRYTDETDKTPFANGSDVSVRGLIEDDFRYKARLSVDAQDVLDEVVNDDALAVRFIDPTYISKFTGSGGDRDTRAALNARYWIEDPTGAPSIGDAAVADRTLGVDPIVDSLSVVDYVTDCISQAKGVFKFNAEGLDYRPLEDPFPRPAPGSGVTRWDLAPKDMPRADAAQTGNGNAALARVATFRKMAIYVKGGRVVQIREKISAQYDLLTKFRSYIERFLGKNDPKAAATIKKQLDAVQDQPAVLEAALNVALNGILKTAGEDPIRFRTMKYEFTRQGENVRADLPVGTDVRQGALDFFGVNSAAKAKNANSTGGSTATTTTSTTTSTTVVP